jgi:hypothetical protein
MTESRYARARRADKDAAVTGKSKMWRINF